MERRARLGWLGEDRHGLKSNEKKLIGRDGIGAGICAWEKGEASPGLVDFCGVARGVGAGDGGGSWLRDGARCAGLGGKRVSAVTGFDLAPSAVRLAREADGGGGVEGGFCAGGFFGGVAVAKVYDWVFEHTLFCAIDPADPGSLCGGGGR